MLPTKRPGRALILALRACDHVLNAAFDTASGAIIEAKKPMSLLAPAFTMTIAIADRGAATHVSVQTEHAGMNWGQNEKLTNELLAKTGEYLGRFET